MKSYPLRKLQLDVTADPCGQALRSSVTEKPCWTRTCRGSSGWEMFRFGQHPKSVLSVLLISIALRKPSGISSCLGKMDSLPGSGESHTVAQGDHLAHQQWHLCSLATCPSNKGLSLLHSQLDLSLSKVHPN